jgi:hypothetical protein
MSVIYATPIATSVGDSPVTTRVRTKTKTPPATRDLHERPPEDCRDDTGRLCAQRDAAVQPLGMFDPNLGRLDGAERLST